MQQPEEPIQSDGRIVLHVGLHRTATTTLQHDLFARLPGVEYIHKPRPKEWRGLGPSSGPRVISNEGALVRGWSGNWRPHWIEELARRFPDAVPLLTLRRHDRWLLSQYRYRVFKGESRPFARFVEERPPVHYMDCVRRLESLFGRPPAIVFQEEIENDFPATAALIARLCGATSTPTIAGRRRNARGRWPLDWALRLNQRFPAQPRPELRVEELRRRAREFATLSMSLAETALRPGTPSIGVDPDQLASVQHAFRDDWRAVIQFTASQRPLLSSALAREGEVE